MKKFCAVIALIAFGTTVASAGPRISRTETHSYVQSYGFTATDEEDFPQLGIHFCGGETLGLGGVCFAVARTDASVALTIHDVVAPHVAGSYQFEKLGGPYPCCPEFVTVGSPGRFCDSASLSIPQDAEFVLVYLGGDGSINDPVGGDIVIGGRSPGCEINQSLGAVGNLFIATGGTTGSVTATFMHKTARPTARSPRKSSKH